MSFGVSTSTRSFSNGRIRSPRLILRTGTKSHEHIRYGSRPRGGSLHDRSHLPQLKKAWTTGQTDDISMYMLLVLASGLALWVAYGVLQKDIVIILAKPSAWR